ncbi:ArsR/SmtB family transcription factor [Paenibacillus sacheonensis]|uniref:ArsR family transcriptional regulator n=1 Tax=Paenibacillus sacheonensis TaxID=742054 RepID=A0A7X4YPV8_9BACL|nr:helix-turn-helix domain-containing protein [Paenibacillus sacheonensis]MBM7564926.1 putative transcriptional regulator [Paenibacillus sacheonensis]NBC70285.1 ArsR family transcriptional regulator [Paenibacillus sacheonensis]
MIIQVNTANMALLECFSSETRVRMIELLDRSQMSIKELAAELGVSSAIVTKHVQKLESAGIIGTESISGARGRLKMCRLLPEFVTLQLRTPTAPNANVYTVSLPIGQYTDFKVKPTCGLSSELSIIGLADDPRYFWAPDHVKAKIIWFASGFLEYRIPNYLMGGQKATSITITLEICSEAPGYNENWPSDISFHMNGTLLGTWTCPGDFGAQKGIFTPDWWPHGTQYGLMKTITIRKDGTFLDGIQLSALTAADLDIKPNDEMRFRLSCPDTGAHAGGISLFGRHFGNYDQEIEVTVTYE